MSFLKDNPPYTKKGLKRTCGWSRLLPCGSQCTLFECILVLVVEVIIVVVAVVGVGVGVGISVAEVVPVFVLVAEGGV